MIPVECTGKYLVSEGQTVWTFKTKSGHELIWLGPSSANLEVGKEYLMFGHSFWEPDVLRGPIFKEIIDVGRGDGVTGSLLASEGTDCGGSTGGCSDAAAELPPTQN